MFRFSITVPHVAFQHQEVISMYNLKELSKRGNQTSLQLPLACTQQSRGIDQQVGFEGKDIVTQIKQLLIPGPLL